MNFYSDKLSNACLFDGPADIVSPHRKHTDYREPPPAKGDKVVVLDTDHLWGVGGNSHEWYSPNARSVTATGTSKTSGGEERFASPFEGSAVLYLIRGGD